MLSGVCICLARLHSEKRKTLRYDTCSYAVCVDAQCRVVGHGLSGEACVKPWLLAGVGE